MTSFEHVRFVTAASDGGDRRSFATPMNVHRVLKKLAPSERALPHISLHIVLNNLRFA
jgi:hypothetical protein